MEHAPCDSVLKIKFKAVSDVPSCTIDPKSPILKHPDRYIASKTRSRYRSIGIWMFEHYQSKQIMQPDNPGVNDFDPLPSPFHFINLPLTIPPSKTGCVTIAFSPTDNDVWPNGRGNCSVPINPKDTFSAQLKLNNSCPISHPIFGIVEPPPENKGLLVKFLPPKVRD